MALGRQQAHAWPPSLSYLRLTGTTYCLLWGQATLGSSLCFTLSSLQPGINRCWLAHGRGVKEVRLKFRYLRLIITEVGDVCNYHIIPSPV